MSEKENDPDIEKFMKQMMQDPEKLKSLQDQEEDPTVQIVDVDSEDQEDLAALKGAKASDTQASSAEIRASAQNIFGSKPRR